jgi:hypothetical protein
VREGSRWSARSRAAARTNELDAGERRRIMRSGEDPFVLGFEGPGAVPDVAGGVVSQAPIGRRASARAAVALVSSPGAPGLNRGGSEVGPLYAVGPLHSGGHVGDSAWFAYGSAPGQDAVTIAFDGRSHQVLGSPRRQLRRLGVHRYPGRSRRG